MGFRFPHMPGGISWSTAECQHASRPPTAFHDELPSQLLAEDVDEEESEPFRRGAIGDSGKADAIVRHGERHQADIPRDTDKDLTAIASHKGIFQGIGQQFGDDDPEWEELL